MELIEKAPDGSMALNVSKIPDEPVDKELRR
jgi:hypothetical protein